jgi:hypothetical protein
VEEQLDDFCTIFIAGQETTANALTWALKELGRNPEWKSSLVEEAEAILGSKDFVEMEDLNKLKETEKVMKEVLRLYPPVQLIGEFHGQGDAKWLVIKGQLRGHNDMPLGRPTQGWPSQGRILWFKLLFISTVIFQHCPPDLGMG